MVQNKQIKDSKKSANMYTWLKNRLLFGKRREGIRLNNDEIESLTEFLQSNRLYFESNIAPRNAYKS